MFFDIAFKIVIPVLGAAAALIAIYKFISVIFAKRRTKKSAGASVAPQQPPPNPSVTSMIEIVADVIMQEGSPAANAVITDTSGIVIAAVNDDGSAVWSQPNDGKVYEYQVKFANKVMFIQNHTNQDVATSFFVDKNRSMVDLTVYHRKPSTKSQTELNKRNINLR